MNAIEKKPNYSIVVVIWFEKDLEHSAFGLKDHAVAFVEVCDR